MSIPSRKSPFTLAEILVAAPWATGLLRPYQDHDKGILLHRNTIDDEWSASTGRMEAIEREARALRADALRRTFATLARRLRVALRPRG